MYLSPAFTTTLEPYCWRSLRTIGTSSAQSYSTSRTSNSLPNRTASSRVFANLGCRWLIVSIFSWHLLSHSMAWLVGSSKRGPAPLLKIITEFQIERESLASPRLFHLSCSPQVTMNLRKLKLSKLNLFRHYFSIVYRQFQSLSLRQLINEAANKELMGYSRVSFQICLKSKSHLPRSSYNLFNSPLAAPRVL